MIAGSATSAESSGNSGLGIAGTSNEIAGPPGTPVLMHSPFSEPGSPDVSFSDDLRNDIVNS